jgi:hypothetical protein
MPAAARPQRCEAWLLYPLHRRAVVAGKTTWAELERRGLVLADRAKGAAWGRAVGPITSGEAR